MIRRDLEHDPDVFADVLAINLTGTMRACSAAVEARRGSGLRGQRRVHADVLRGGRACRPTAPPRGESASSRKASPPPGPGEGVRVNAVAPGWIATPLTQALQEDSERGGPILSRTPMGRWGTPEEVAGAAIFLASPAARFVTGAILAVDGGYLTV